MYIIPLSVCKNQYKVNYNSQNNIKNNTIYSKQISSNANLVKASAENYKANYMVSFKGGMSSTTSNSSGIGTLNHQTAFFREPKTDEIVQDYILKHFGNDKEINIVSGACSTGEEAKSYAMMLDTLDDKLKITGFDISPVIVKEAQGNSCQLTKFDDNNSPINLVSLDSENILLNDDTDNLTEYEKKCRNKFKQYYQPKGLPQKVLVFPNAKKELEDLERLLTNKEEFEKANKLYNERMQIAQNLTPEIAQYMSNISFEDTLKMSQHALEQQVDVYKTVADFEAKEHSFDNCSFILGDVTNIENMFQPDSINVLLYRNALYHTLCRGNNMMRCMKDDAPETMDFIAKQMNKILKINGLVVFGENEFMQGVDTNIIEGVMKNNGFRLLQQNYNDNIWVKCENI